MKYSITRITGTMLLLLAIYMAHAQSLTPTVVPSGGGYYTGTGAKLSWTSGQTFNSTLTGGSNILTLGFQQPEMQIYTNALSSNTYLQGAAVSVPFTAEGFYSAANVYTAQLSNASGSFANPVNIGTLSSTASGTIAAVIPSGTAAGIGYRIRVVSNASAFKGKNNGTNLTILPSGCSTVYSDLYAVIDSGSTYSAFGHVYSSAQTVVDTLSSVTGCDSIVTLHLTMVGHCTLAVSNNSGHVSPCGPMTFTATALNNSGAISYQWYRNNTLVGTNSATYTATSLNYNDSVWVSVTAMTGCSSTAKSALSNKIKITGVGTNIPTVSASASKTNLDLPGTVILTATPMNAGSNPHYAWYRNGALVSGATTSVMSYGGGLGNGDHIYCTLTTTTCGVAQNAVSDTITFSKSGSNAKDITVLTMPAQVGTSVINNGAATVNAVVTTAAAGRTSIHPTRIATSTLSTYGPSYSVNRDFSLPVTYTVTAQNGSSKVWTVTVVDQTGHKTNGLAETDAVIGMNLYPDPATTFINVRCKGGMEIPVITMLDIEGRVLYHQVLPATETVNHQIDLSYFAAGTYVIYVAVGDRIETKKFVITK